MIGWCKNCLVEGSENLKLWSFKIFLVIWVLWLVKIMKRTQFDNYWPSNELILCINKPVLPAGQLAHKSHHTNWSRPTRTGKRAHKVFEEHSHGPVAWFVTPKLYCRRRSFLGFGFSLYSSRNIDFSGRAWPPFIRTSGKMDWARGMLLLEQIWDCVRGNFSKLI